MFNECLPADFPFQNLRIGKSEMGHITDTLIVSYDSVVMSTTLDKMKSLSFTWATRSGGPSGLSVLLSFLLLGDAIARD